MKKVVLAVLFCLSMFMTANIPTAFGGALGIMHEIQAHEHESGGNLSRSSHNDPKVVQKTKDLVEKQVYKQAIGAAASAVVGSTAGGIIGGIATPTKTVDQKTEMQQKADAIQNQLNGTQGNTPHK